MPTYREPGVLTGMSVGRAMQKTVARAGPDEPLSQCVRMMIKLKTDAVLVAEDTGMGQGVVSKTDIMGAFYAGLPVETPAKDIMMGPVVTCGFEEKLDTVLDGMKTRGIHQVFVEDDETGTIIGKLTFSEIVGLLYRYCRNCAKSRRCPRDLEKEKLPRLTIKDVMTTGIETCMGRDSLYQVMDLLSEGRIKALPVVGQNRVPQGIISKTDLVLAYIRGTEPDCPARDVMNSPLLSCEPDTPLSQAILKMFLADIGHLFISEPGSGRIAGVVSLSDAARFRSGTCRACSTGRML